MDLNLADGKITRIDTSRSTFTEAEYDLGTTTKANFFAAVGKGERKGQLVLIPVTAVQAIYTEVELVEQQNSSKNKA